MWTYIKTTICVEATIYKVCKVLISCTCVLLHRKSNYVTLIGYFLRKPLI